MTTTEALLIGRRRRLALTMVGGFAALVALSLGLAIVAERADIASAAGLTDRIVPLLVFYAPAPIAAVGAYARCGGLACLAVGAVPAVVLTVLVVLGTVVVGTVVGVPGVDGGTPFAGTTLTFASIGLSGAFVGYCAGVTAALLADLAGIGKGSGSGAEDGADGS